MGCGQSTHLDVGASPTSDTPRTFGKPTKSALKRPSAQGGPAASSTGLSDSDHGEIEAKRQYQAALAMSIREAASDKKTLEEYTLSKVKSRLLLEWHPEYEPESAHNAAAGRCAQWQPNSGAGHLQDDYTVSERATLIQFQDIVDDSTMTRKTKIICTLGPACSTTETLGELIDSGLNVARLNFSHGSHESHLHMLNLFRDTCEAKSKRRAVLLDTKGPEIRTSILKDGHDIMLEQGQDIVVEAVGEGYVSFEGFKTQDETRIGLSYDNLCQSVVPGNKILLADGSISIEVTEILSSTELRGKVLNSKALGQRKNCNLPGVKVNLPVLMDKDIDDLQQFACKHKVDFVAASFVQSKEDVLFVRKILDEAGGHDVKIISKIENMAGLENINGILEATDGVMVARGDLGMEIPPEKVPLAQKMLITKCNIAGKMVVCATQMLESMIEAMRPTRAEMTDTANAVYDGADAVMLSGETANGKFPAEAVRHMADIVANAEVGVDYYKQFNFIRYWATRRMTAPLSDAESLMCSAATMAVLYNEDTSPHARRRRLRNGACIVCLSESGAPARLIAKYRPPAMVFTASSNDQTVRQANAYFGMAGIKIDSMDVSSAVLASIALRRLEQISDANIKAVRVIVVTGRGGGSADGDPVITHETVGGRGLTKDLKSSGAALTTPSGTPLAASGTRSLRATNTSLALVAAPVRQPRATRVVCTLGPACWGEEGMAGLLAAGCDIFRFNFSHGDHAGHLEVLERFRKVCDARASEIKAQTGAQWGPVWGALLDTKGPEIRTAMLRGGESLQLEKDQDIIVEAVGDAYTEFEGYTDEKETRIGLSYAKLCSSVSPGDRILLADGSVAITVQKILSPTELLGQVMGSCSLGQRKNCNLPGVKVDLPVLTDKDIHDLQQFACKHAMDFVAASFVQSAADVRFIRSVLDGAGGFDIKIISKIENQEGLNNFAEILRETDGIMIARGDLGMEIPSSKVPHAQKLMVTKCNLHNKFAIVATQMLESMIKNPRPTRAELTDVANAVIDGADAVMLSGETANGVFPAGAVRTMAEIARNAEHIVDARRRFDWLRAQTPAPLESAEAVASSAAAMALDSGARAVLCFTHSGRAAALLSKYAPPVPVFVAAEARPVLVACRARHGLHGVHMPFEGMPIAEATEQLVQHINSSGVLRLEPGEQVVVVCRRSLELGSEVTMDDQRLAVRAHIVGNGPAVEQPFQGFHDGSSIVYRSTKIGLDTILDRDKYKHIVRKCKIICTLGPQCDSEEMLGKLLDAGMDVARMNFSHGDHASHLAVLTRFRAAAAARGSLAACLLDTKGPEIRTSMLAGGGPVQLRQGQSIIFEAVGDAYTTFEGYSTADETRIGLSYSRLAQTVKPGGKILLADGTISIEVEEILSETEVRGTVQNSKALGQRKNCNLPGVKVDLPVLMEKDVNDLQNFACKHGVDFVAASFVQSKEDVLHIRRVLDDAGGQAIGIIAKIENQEGLQNYEEILEVTDGIMVARGDLGMEIPVQKVPLAQKMMIAKANIAGRFVICATQMMESMIDAPHPTSAEISDVANAVWDGADACMLSGETANGAHPALAVSIMASLQQHAELGVNHNQTFNFVRDFTPKPVGTVEASVSALAKNAVDLKPGMVVVFSEGGKMARLAAKYRPCVPLLVVTSNAALARRCSVLFACAALLLDAPMQDRTNMLATLRRALAHGVEAGLCVPGKEVVVLASTAVTQSGVGHGAERELFVTVAPGTLQFEKLGSLAPHFLGGEVDLGFVAKAISLRATRMDLAMVMHESQVQRKTKIICTAMPTTTAATLRALVGAGMDVLRLNLSHCAAADAAAVLADYRDACAEAGRLPCVLCELRGSELRSSYLVDREAGTPVKDVALRAGQPCVLFGSAATSPLEFVGWSEEEGARVGVQYEALGEITPLGTLVSMCDGAVAIRVDEILSRSEVRGTVVADCTLAEHTRVCIRGQTVRMPFLTDRDAADLRWAAAQHVNFVAVPFTRTEEDVAELRDQLNSCGGDHVRIIAKVEDADGLRNLDAVLDASDGIIIARGSLGLEISPEKVALAQKLCTTKCNIRGKVSIVTRHMLRSMVVNPRPTRAEMLDVASAVFESADAVVLGEETAVGSFPIDAVQTMASIITNAEEATHYYALHSFSRDFSAKPFTSLEASSYCLARMALDADVKAIVTFTASGGPAQICTKYRPPVPHFVATTDKHVAEAASLYFGMLGCMLKSSKGSVQESLALVLAEAKAQGLYSGGKVAVMHGHSDLFADQGGVLSIVDPDQFVSG
eukprot:jgi/Ulvmu1/3513/UM162_0020.1